MALKPCLSLNEPNPTSVYIHLPFCKKKCFYCDFPVVALGSDNTSSQKYDAMQTYVSALINEINKTLSDNKGSQILRTIYFGGGTPSLIPPALISTILQCLKDKIGISPDAEVTLEADPGTFDERRLEDYISLGVNRISMGVQSFDESLLKSCGRSHSVADIRESISIIQKVRRVGGLRSWSLDLISALPGLSLPIWKETLDSAIEAGPDHVSCYDLQLEEGTPFARWHDQGKIRMPPDEMAAQMYSTAVSALTSQQAGYEHYEVSNYSRQGHRSRHNQIYWTARDPYYAFGLGAASFVNGVRHSRPSKLAKYYEYVESLTAGGDEGPSDPRETEEDGLLNMVMLRLRTSDGLDMRDFSDRFGEDAAGTVTKSLQKHIERGLVLNQDHKIRLSDPNGFLLSNDIISDVFAAFKF